MIFRTDSTIADFASLVEVVAINLYVVAQYFLAFIPFGFVIQADSVVIAFDFKC